MSHYLREIDFSVLLNFPFCFRHIADRMGTPHLQKVLNQVRTAHLFLRDCLEFNSVREFEINVYLFSN